jgi:hypothetical protein
MFFASNGTTPNPDVVVPYSIGDYIAEEDRGTVTTFQPGDLLPQDLANETTHVPPITGDGSTATISPGLPRPPRPTSRPTAS